MFKRKLNPMLEIQQRDMEESRRIDIRAKFDSTFIPGVHHEAEHLPTGVHGWYDHDGKLHMFDPDVEKEVTPTSLDAWQEERLTQLTGDA